MSKDRGALTVEEQGIDTISEDERKGTPGSLFWPWFAANISMFAMSYGAWALGFGISLWQATIMAIIGVVVSFLLVGVISIAGKRGNAPTMVLTRATFGVEGAKVPAALSWIATLGWEISLTTTAVLALSSTITKLGWGSGDAPKLISAIVVVGLVVVAGIFGYDLIMHCQQVITIVTGVITVGFFILGWGHIDFAAIGRIPSGSLPAMLGCCFFVMTGFGLGWVNIAADYSRYLPRKASNGGIVFWTTFGASIANVFLIFYGLLLAGSNAKLAENVGNDPIGAMASILPTWYLIPYTLVAGPHVRIYHGQLLQWIGTPELWRQTTPYGGRWADRRAHRGGRGLRDLLLRYLYWPVPRFPNHPRCAHGRVGRHVCGRCDSSQEGLQHSRPV